MLKTIKWINSEINRMLLYSQSSLVFIIIGIVFLFVGKYITIYVSFLGIIFFLLVIADIVSKSSGNKQSIFHMYITILMFLLDVSSTIAFSEMNVNKFLEREGNFIFTLFLNENYVLFSVLFLMLFKFYVHVLLASAPILYLKIREMRPKDISIIGYSGERYFHYGKSFESMLSKYREYKEIFLNCEKKISVDLFFSISADASGRLYLSHLLYIMVFVWNTLAVLHIHDILSYDIYSLIVKLVPFFVYPILLSYEFFAFKITERFLKKDLDLPDIDEFLE